MVEEARLESVYTGNRIEGSNPSVSAERDKRGKTLFVPFLITSASFVKSDIKGKVVYHL